MRPFILAAVAIALLTAIAVWLINAEGADPAGPGAVASVTQEKPKLLPDDGEDDEAKASPSGEARKTGEVTVTVTSGGKSVAGAFVRLYSIDQPEGATEPQFRLVVEGTTADDGRVELTAARGRYTAVVRATGFPQTARSTRLREKPEELTVELQSGGSVKGQFLAGNSKTPVPNVTFRIECTSESLGERVAMLPPDERQLYDADAHGKFEAGPLEAGVHQLIVETPGFSKSVTQFFVPRSAELVVRLFQSATLEGVVVDERGENVPLANVSAQLQRSFEFLHATTDAEGRFKLEVSPGQLWLSATAGDASMSSQFPVVVGPGAAVKDVKLVLAAGAVFEGTVVGIDGALANAEVKLIRDGTGAPKTVRSDPKGQWSFRGLPQGTYHLRAEAKGYVDVWKRDLAVMGGQSRRFELKLEPAGRIEGTIVDAQSAPVRDARITASAGAQTMPTFATSDSEGKFVLKSLKPGEWELTARGKLGGTAQTKLTVTAGEVATAELQLTATGVIKGRVKMADGSAPLELLMVSARPKSTDRGGIGPVRMSFMNTVRQSARPDGSYELHVPAGEHTVVVSAAERFRFTRNDLNQKDVSLAAGETKELDFEWTQDDALEEMISGVVVDARGAPAAGARVAVAEGKARLFDGIETSEDGRFVVGVPPEKPKGKLRVEARFGAMRGVLEDVSPGDKKLRLVLSDAGVIEGRVQSTRVIEEFKLTARPGPGGRGTEEVTYAGERFALRNLSPGDIEIAVATTDGRAGRGTFKVEAGKVTEVVIEVKESATVKGSVSAKDMAAFGFVSLRLVRVANPRESSSARAEPDGAFVFQGIAAGEYDLVAHAGRRWERRISVPGTGTVDVGELDVSRTAPGLIGIEYGYDREGVVVTAMDKDGPAQQAGVQVGDIILAADGTPVKGKTGREALRGAPGSAVQLTVKRGETSSTLTVIRAK